MRPPMIDVVNRELIRGRLADGDGSGILVNRDAAIEDGVQFGGEGSFSDAAGAGNDQRHVDVGIDKSDDILDDLRASDESTRFPRYEFHHD